MTERQLMQSIQFESSRRGWRLFRNNTAMGWVGDMIPAPAFYGPNAVVLLNARPIHAGLCKGSSDLIGWKTGGQFTAIEVKLPGKKPTLEQVTFIRAVRASGGDGRIVDSLENL